MKAGAAGKLAAFSMRTVPRHRFLVLPLLLAAALTVGALAGCGKKGPLYLPEPARQADRNP